LDDDMTLTEFLLARIAEDEAVASAASIGRHWTWDGPDLLSDHIGAFRLPECIIDTEGANPPDPEGAGVHIARWDPARVLAECEAKRRIVAEMANYWVEGASRTGDLPEVVLTALALPYADHPDYRDAWRP
jgi:hypothetical protein